MGRLTLTDQANNVVRVTLDDLGKLANVIDAARQAGGSSVPEQAQKPRRARDRRHYGNRNVHSGSQRCVALVWAPAAADGAQ